ncbi:hypothetical protein [uncultured Clostridium sp.]|uniref:hypothetical protein n=1 Tax=uncultured Clostridium sp. TaxID=59620 RepID=UPI0026308CB9|nr:hypothetical protein [uncultured Clostridium sp.]
MKKKSLKKWIIVGIVVVLIIIVIGVIAAVINGITSKEKQNADNSYKNSYQYKMQREKNSEVLKGFYGNYIVTGISGTSPSIQLSQDDLNTLKNNMIGSQVNIEANGFSIKYNGTNAINGNTYTNANINNPYYEVNQTNESMFETVYKTSLSNVGITTGTPYFINVGDKDDYEHEIIQNGKGGLLIYNQGVFFNMEAASKILAEKNAQLEKLANDALKTATGSTYQYVFPVQQTDNNGKIGYKNAQSGGLFMCKAKDNSLTPDKDTMFITLTEGVVQPQPQAQNNANNNKTDNKTQDNKPQDKNAGKPFYNFSISTADMMDHSKPSKPIVGKVYLDGSVEVTKG